MKVILFTLFILMFQAFNVIAAPKDDTANYHYELESYKGLTAPKGYKAVKVWNYGKREKVTKRLCMQTAVHGILFKGFAAADMQSSEKGMKALVPDGYDAHKEYFDGFFESGAFEKYVQLTNNGMLDAADVMKVNKREYRIGMVVFINVEALKQQLIKDKVIKGLDFLFK